MSKAIASLLLIGLLFVLSYFNMTITWGVTLKSWPAFFTFFALHLVVVGLMEVVKRDK